MKPEIRFEGYGDEWKLVRLKEIVERITRKNDNLSSENPLTISAQHGLISQIKYYKWQVASKNLSNYYLIFKGEFGYNKSYSAEYPVGAIKRLDLYSNGVLSTLYIAFKPIDVNSNFLKQYYESNYWHEEINNIAEEGARNHGLLNISPEDFFNTKILLPEDKIEQNKIGNIHELLDENLNLREKELSKLKQFKQAMLQKLFPKEGETVPEIRFEGFKGEWNKYSLNDIAEIIGGGTPSTSIAEYWNGDIDWYSPNEIINSRYVCNSKKKITEVGLNKSSAKILPANKTILFTSRATIGEMAILKEEAATNQGFQSLIIREQFDVNFVYTIGFKIKEYALNMSSGSTFLEISGKTLGKVNIRVPNIKEQEQIGNYFVKLDKNIELKQKELDKLNHFKQAMLDKMFV